MCHFCLYWHVGFYVGKVKTSLACLSEMTGFEMIFDMLAILFPAIFVTLGPAIFIVFIVVGFQFCTSLQFSRESCSLKKAIQLVKS